MSWTVWRAQSDRAASMIVGVGRLPAAVAVTGLRGAEDREDRRGVARAVEVFEVYTKVPGLLLVEPLELLCVHSQRETPPPSRRRTRHWCVGLALVGSLPTRRDNLGQGRADEERHIRALLAMRRRGRRQFSCRFRK